MQENIAEIEASATKEGADGWTPRDTGWMLNLFGTAIGAGVLYLPINAGAGGIWPLVILSLLAGPMVWLAHRNLVRFCLSSTDPQANITVTVHEHFGEKVGHALTWAYSLSIYPILLMYAIGMTNVVLNYMESQLGIIAPSRLWICIVLVSVLVLMMHIGERWMLRAVKAMVYPLVITLVCISAYLIPYWNTSVFSKPFDINDMLITLFFTTPLLIFSFNHSPACSAFAQTYRMAINNKEACERKTQKILKRNTLLLLVVILFFVFSSVLTLTPEQLQQAKQANLPVLSVLAEGTGNSVFALFVPVIAFLAIVSSFFGVYLGALEGIQGIVTQQWLKYCPRKPMHPTGMRRMTMVFIVITCWIAGYANWSVIGMIEVIVVPILAMILYVMPVYAYYHVKSLAGYRNKWLDVFIAMVGIVAIFGFVLNKLV